jgi:hypothetical protein
MISIHNHILQSHGEHLKIQDDRALMLDNISHRQTDLCS